ncbi:hypothetical protein DL764_009561 [Monosporascus ibericus]|uniref:BZIP domain-containing protein n=1 Tax=Monosporascus ibericus TaxID=155417 RepID=A0A4Q4SUP6_9PEZI|nr:hypothetical protein DL764_009561 [Monosporascus ibericus]
MDCYDLGTMNKKAEDGLPSCSFPNLQDSSYSFSSNEENMVSWGNGIIYAESGDVDTEVSMFTSAFLDQPTSPSMSDFVSPGALSSQEDPQGIFNFWPATHKQQSGLALSTPAQAHQQPEQEITEKQHLRPQHNYASSSLMQSTPCPASNSYGEETVAGIVNRIHKNSQFACQDDIPPEPLILPRDVKRQRTKNNMDEAKRFLASKAGKELSTEYVARLENDVAHKTNENNDLRIQNRALMEENARLMVLIETLLPHPALTPFLEDISRDEVTNNPALSTSSAAPTEELRSALQNGWQVLSNVREP